MVYFCTLTSNFICKELIRDTENINLENIIHLLNLDREKKKNLLPNENFSSKETLANDIVIDTNIENKLDQDVDIYRNDRNIDEVDDIDEVKAMCKEMKYNNMYLKMKIESIEHRIEETEGYMEAENKKFGEIDFNIDEANEMNKNVKNKINLLSKKKENLLGDIEGLNGKLSALLKTLSNAIEENENLENETGEIIKQYVKISEAPEITKKSTLENNNLLRSKILLTKNENNNSQNIKSYYESLNNSLEIKIKELNITIESLFNKIFQYTNIEISEEVEVDQQKDLSSSLMSIDNTNLKKELENLKKEKEEKDFEIKELQYIKDSQPLEEQLTMSLEDINIEDMSPDQRKMYEIMECRKDILKKEIFIIKEVLSSYEDQRKKIYQDDSNYEDFISEKLEIDKKVVDLQKTSVQLQEKLVANLNQFNILKSKKEELQFKLKNPAPSISLKPNRKKTNTASSQTLPNKQEEKDTGCCSCFFNSK